MSANTTQAPSLIVPERITIVLKAKEGSTLEHICQFVSLGMPVAIGRGMAVIAGASDEDLQMTLGEERDDRQIQAELQQQSLGAPAHLAANARRYEWLRNNTCIEDADNDLMVVRGDNYFTGDELDREIDNALRLSRLEELHPCAD